MDGIDFSGVIAEIGLCIEVAALLSLFVILKSRVLSDSPSSGPVPTCLECCLFVDSISVADSLY